MGEGLVLKLVYSPVCAGNFSVELVCGNNLFIPPSQLASPDAKPRLCAYRTVVPNHKLSENGVGK